MNLVIGTLYCAKGNRVWHHQDQELWSLQQDRDGHVVLLQECLLLWGELSQEADLINDSTAHGPAVPQEAEAREGREDYAATSNEKENLERMTVAQEARP